MTTAWEHKRVIHNIGDQQSVDEKIRSLGAEGWELVTAETSGSPSYSACQTILWFKRPKPGAHV